MQEKPRFSKPAAPSPHCLPHPASRLHGQAWQENVRQRDPCPDAFSAPVQPGNHGHATSQPGAGRGPRRTGSSDYGCHPVPIPSSWDKTSPPASASWCCPRSGVAGGGEAGPWREEGWRALSYFLSAGPSTGPGPKTLTHRILHPHPGPLAWVERGTGSALPEPRLALAGPPCWLSRAPSVLFPTGATDRTWGTPGSLRRSELEGSQDAQSIPVTDPEG